MAKASYKTIDEYFDTCSSQIVEKMMRIREIVREKAPQATEKISWGMPTFYLNGNLVHFFAHKNHIGFYPGESGIENFKDTFKENGYKYSKGAVQFPLNKDIPYNIIMDIVEFRVNENLNKI